MHKFRKGITALMVSAVMISSFFATVSAEYDPQIMVMSAVSDSVSKINAVKSMLLNSKPYYDVEYDVFDYCRAKNEALSANDSPANSEEVTNTDNTTASDTSAGETTLLTSADTTTAPVLPPETVSESTAEVTTVPAETSTPEVTTTVRQPKPNVSYSKFGIDVSVHQGTINWSAVKNDGVDYAILRAGYGSLKSQIDKSFEYNYAQCKKNGIPVGAYWYSYAKTVAEAEQEAETFIYSLKGKKFEYPVYFDIEDNSQVKLNRQLLTDIAIAFCSRMENAGYYVGIYTNVNWTENLLYKAQLTDYDKWLAHWTSAPKYGNSFGGMWQYGAYGTVAQVEKGQATMYGQINGISAACDVNVCYRDYPSLIISRGFNGY